MRYISRVYETAPPVSFKKRSSNFRKFRGINDNRKAHYVWRYFKSKGIGEGQIPNKIRLAEICAKHFQLTHFKFIDKDLANKIIDKCNEIIKIGPVKKKTNRQKAIEFYESDAWRSLRYQALKEYGRKCMVCGATPESGAQLHVDHIKPRSKFPELELVLANLQILCRDCNLGKSNTDCIDWRQADNEHGVGADSSVTLESDRENLTEAHKR